MKKITALRRSGIVIAIFAVAMFFGFAADTNEVNAAENTITVQVTGTYGQTEARTMLDMVNDFRTGRYIDGDQTSVWARNQSGGIDTSNYTNLGELQYDYELEKVAMQRAMEIALSFEHQRPNDSSWSSLFPDGYSAQGENIAAGYGNGNQTARQAFEGWCETNYPYGGQGHRRNMLGRGYNRIGVGHVAISWSGRLTEGTRPYNYSTTIHFWVQEFGYRTDSFGLTQTSASDVKETREVELLPSKVTQAGITTSKDSLSITYGDSYEFNDASTSIRYEDTFPDEFNLTWTDGATSKGPYLLPVEGGYSLSSNNQNIASVSGKTINAVNVGETSLTINPEMAGAQSATVNVKVEPASLKNATISVVDPTYTGAALTPSTTVTVNGKTLVKDRDYEASYSNNINAGNNTATVTITGKGNYKDSASKKFSILQKSVAELTISNINTVTYSGLEHTPPVTLTHGSRTLQENTDYAATYSNNINAGTATATITGKGNYKGTVSKDFTINAKALTDSMVTLNKIIAEYSGASQSPTVTVKDGTRTLSDGTDYTLTNNGGTAVGTYTVSVEGKGNYSGTISKDFTITRKALTEDMINISESTFTYNGETQKPDQVTVKFGDLTLAQGDDYTLTNEGGVNAGDYGVEITGKGNYSGTATKAYTISKKPVNEDMINLSGGPFTYNGKTQKPDVTVMDGAKELDDAYYELINEGGKNAGDYTVTLSGKGNYSGNATKTFTIKKLSIGDSSILASAQNVTYTGAEVVPDVTVSFGDTTLSKGDDFTVSSAGDSVNVGTVEATIEGKGNFEGQRKVEFNITQKYLGDEDISVENIPRQILEVEGDEVRPTPVIKYNGMTLTADDFDLAYENNTAKGTGKVIVTGKGNFIGELTLEFEIILKDEAEAEDAEARANQKGADGTPLGEGASAEYAEKAILASTSDEGPRGSKFAPLTLKSTKQANTSVTLSWTRNSKAVKYVIYGNACGKKNKMKKLNTVTGKSCKITKISKKLKKGTYHKFMVVALDSNNDVVSASKVVHVATKGGKVGNHKSVTIKAKVNKSGKAIKSYKALTSTKIRKGKSIKIKNKTKAVSKKKKVKKHRKVSYESSNPKVATVSASGKVVARDKGTCYIFAYSQNGVFKKLKITVN